MTDAAVLITRAVGRIHLLVESQSTAAKAQALRLLDQALERLGVTTSKETQ
jgi:hypothetical protein